MCGCVGMGEMWEGRERYSVRRGEGRGGGGREGGRRTIRGQCIFNDPLAHVIHVFVVDLIGPGGQWGRRSEGGVGG